MGSRAHTGAHLVEFPKPVLLQVLGLQGKEMRVRYEENPDDRAQMSTWRNGLAQVGRQLIHRARRLWGGNELAASLGQGYPEGMGSPGRARGVQRGFNQHSLPPGMYRRAACRCQSSPGVQSRWCRGCISCGRRVTVQGTHSLDVQG